MNFEDKTWLKMILRYHTWLKSEGRKVMEENTTELTFGHGQEESAETTEEVVEEVEDTKDEEAVEDTKEPTKDEPNDGEETKEEEAEPVKKDNKMQALNSERARRKQAEKELKELKARLEKEKQEEDDKALFNSERENLKKKILEKDFDEGTADMLLEVFGDDIVKNKIANERRAEEDSFEKEFAEFMKDDMFMDADVYKPQIKELMKKGLTMEQAYGASIPASRYAQMKKDIETEVEQRLLNNEVKAEKIDIGHAEAKDEAKRASYTKREQEIARETGVDVKDVHKRMNIHTLDEMLELNKKE